MPLLAAVALGIAQGAVDDVSRQTRTGRTARRGQLADAPVSMAELASERAREPDDPPPRGGITMWLRRPKIAFCLRER
jgi:hypothetical protein